MTAQNYLEALFEQASSPIAYEGDGSDDAILDRLLSKKFRKTKADQELLTICKSALADAKSRKGPIKAGILFGGNKLWRLDEAPEIDWAELFSVLYYINWMKYVSAIYKPGVTIEYYSQDNSVSVLNNLDMQDLTAYTNSFRKMLASINPKLPTGLSITYTCHSSKFESLDDYLAEIAEAKAAMLVESNNSLPSLTTVQLRATVLNVKLTPGQDLDPEWQRKVELNHQAIFRTKSLIPHLMDATIIPISPTPFPGCLALGSTKTAIAKFWVCVGALQPLDDSFREVLLTPSNISTTKCSWQDVHMPGITGQNMSRIRVLEA